MLLQSSRPPRARGLKLPEWRDTSSSETSRPPRARGLKRRGEYMHREIAEVAPPAGAWIETLNTFLLCRSGHRSRPPRARGLKQTCNLRVNSTIHVAPPAGAWIETATTRQDACVLSVAPPAGAWIETKNYSMNHSADVSRPPRARGLKLSG